jgi:hypothetical protein
MIMDSPYVIVKEEENCIGSKDSVVYLQNQFLAR